MPEVRWYHLFMLYNVVLPVTVYYLAKIILSKRPTGYGNAEITDMNPELNKFKYILVKLGKREIKIHPFLLGGAIIIVLFFIGVSPLMIHAATSQPENDIHLDFIIDKDFNMFKINSLAHDEARFYFLSYREESC